MIENNKVAYCISVVLAATKEYVLLQKWIIPVDIR